MNIYVIFIALILFFGNVTFAEEVLEWGPKLNWSGDIRYRLARSKEGVNDARVYRQLRVRLGVRAEVNETTQAVVRLATATSAISANQTLGDANDPGMARRPFGLDVAYMDFNIPEIQSHVWLGRVANPFWAPAKVQTLFDADLAFEGLAIKFKPEWRGLFANLGGFIVSENYTAPDDGVDTGLVGGELGIAWKRSDRSWTTRFGNYYYLNVKNQAITRMEKSAKIDSYSKNPNERFRGNTVYVNDSSLPAVDRKYFYANEYILLELGSEWKHKLGEFEYTLYVDAVKNDAVRKAAHALEAGAALKWRRLSVGYAHVKKEADSMIGSLTDSDTNGGGTANQGHRAHVNMAFNKNTSIQITYFKAKRGIDVIARNFEMTHADVLVSF